MANRKSDISKGKDVQDIQINESITDILTPSEDRNWVVMVNAGKFDCYIAFGKPPVIGKGWVLGREGGHLLMDLAGVTQETIRGIADGGKTNLCVQESD